jgi:AraC family transcriptional regulator of adaptative response/methylated-DNA-[protein]-cysteine methyltransferase
MQHVRSGALTEFQNDEARWEAVENRNSNAEGAFVYGVTSTGIFCRPTCPSRRPLRDRVAFFEDAKAAIASGFRPCKRCRPESTLGDSDFVVRVVEALDEWPEGQPTLDELADVVGLSPSHVQRKFKAATGISPAEYSRQRRLEKFRTELRGGRAVTDSIYEAGFDSAASVYGSIGRELGMTPTAYQAGGVDRTLNYLTAESSLGRVLLAYTDIGVAAIMIGDDDQALVEQLADEFPEAELVGQTGDHPWLQQVLDYLSGDIPHPELPLEIRGTAFQRRVWQAIRVIPPGQTRTYGQLAAEIGKPSATRAVANACGQNRLALAIPCHRVVRANGSSGGYRWGDNRKSALLALESSD